MRHDVKMGREATRTDQIRAAGVNQLRGTATALALAAFVLSLGCQVTERRDDGDEGGAGGSAGFSGAGASGSAGVGGTEGDSGAGGAAGSTGGSSGATGGSTAAGGTGGSVGCDTCEWADDGACDEPDICPPGTDCTDCGPGTGGASGAGGSGGAAGNLGAGGSGGGSCDTSVFADVYWSDTSTCLSVCHDTQLRSDGTYQKRLITTSPVARFCEHGTWQALDCGTIQFTNACTGASYTQPWSYSPGVFVLESVTYTPDSIGFDCGTLC